MARAIWNGRTIAESDDVALVEGNAYFPAASVDRSCLRKSEDTVPTYCHWKGTAEYYDVVVEGDVNPGAAWTYPSPYPAAAAAIADRFAFWGGIEVEGAAEGTGLVEGEPDRNHGLTGWQALCWLIRHSPETELTAAEVEHATGIPGSSLAAAWEEYDVQRYATRYQWILVGRGEGGEALRLVSTGPRG